MGVCCTASQLMDEEIERCQSVDALSEVMNKKKEEIAQERNELKENIENDEYIGKISNLSSSDKRKRILYLEQIERCYQNVLALLKENSNLEINQTKEHLNEICNHYWVAYDEKKKYNISFDKFRTFVESNKK